MAKGRDACGRWHMCAVRGFSDLPPSMMAPLARGGMTLTRQPSGQTCKKPTLHSHSSRDVEVDPCGRTLRCPCTELQRRDRSQTRTLRELITAPLPPSRFGRRSEHSLRENAVGYLYRTQNLLYIVWNREKPCKSRKITTSQLL